jgi:serine/threonine-protein kinase
MTEIHEVESNEGRRYFAKILRPDCVAMLQVVERLRLEGDVLAALDDPHVVRLQGRGRTTDGRPYLILEHLVGRTLRREVVRRKTIPPLEAAELAIQLLEGLMAVHAIGVVHRDLKPDNLFLCRSKEAAAKLKILDFGFAKVLETPSTRSVVPPLAISTDEQEFVGGHRYVAPEQIQIGKPFDHRADLYLVGLVLHTLLTGREPFHDVRSPRELLQAQIEETLYPPSTETADQVPEELLKIIRRATSKDPDARYQKASEFAGALWMFVGVRRVPQEPSGKKTLSVQQHAEMTAAIEIEPERAREIRTAYGIVSSGQLLAIETWFQSHVEKDPDVLEKWRALVDIYVARKRSGGGGR